MLLLLYISVTVGFSTMNIMSVKRPLASVACRWGIALYCTCHNNVNNEMFHFLLLVDIELGLLVFDFTFNNFSIILWQSFLLMEKSRVPLNNMKERNIVFDICRWYRIWWNSICTSNINSFKIVLRIGTCDAGYSSSKFHSSCLPFVVKQTTLPDCH
jgi:hypothetical protein